MNRVTHFDLKVENPEKVSSFYSSVFDWKFQKWNGPFEYWMIMTGEGKGIDGGMSLKKDDSFSAMTIEVDDLDKKIEEITSAGGKIIAEKMDIPNVGLFAIFQDPDGNKFGLMQENKKEGDE